MKGRMACQLRRCGIVNEGFYRGDQFGRGGRIMHIKEPFQEGSEGQFRFPKRVDLWPPARR